MKWTPGGGESPDIEDRRDSSGGGGFQFGGIHIGIGGAILLFILSFVFKTNLFALLGGGTGDPGTAVSQPDPARDEAEKPLVQFVSFVLDDTQNTWTQLLPQQTGTQYRHAKLVLFRDYTQSGCGGAQSATGPFYCPEDEKVYIDLGFFGGTNYSRHGQGRHEVIVPGRRAPDCEARDHPAQRLGIRAQKSSEAGGEQTQVSVVRKACEPGIVGRHIEGA